MSGLLLCCLVIFFFFTFICLSLSPPFNSTLSFLIQHINEGQICTRGRGVYVCACVEPCMAEHTVQYCGGWLAGWGCGWQAAAAETSAGAPLSHPVIVSPMKGSLITPAQRGLPSSPIPEIHYSPLSLSLSLHPPFPSLLHLLLLPYLPLYPLLSYPPSSPSCNIQPQGWGGFKDSLSLSKKKKKPRHINTHTQKLPESTCVYMCVRTLNLPKQFFQCNWAWGTCVHEIAQPLLHASCSGVYVPLLALQCRQLPNHILTGVFERLLSTREWERKRERE